MVYCRACIQATRAAYLLGSSKRYNKDTGMYLRPQFASMPPILLCF